jgi:hypothetical protein
MFLGVTSVLEVGDGVFEVLSTSGDTHLGGDDFDKVGHSPFSFSYYICLSFSQLNKMKYVLN